VNDVARAKARGKKGPRGLPWVDPQTLRLPNRAWRHEHPVALQGVGIGESAKGRIGGLHLHQVRLAQNRQFRQRLAVRDAGGVGIAEPGASAGRRARLRASKVRSASNVSRSRTSGARVSSSSKCVVMCCRLLPKPQFLPCQPINWRTSVNWAPVDEVQLSCDWLARAQLTRELVCLSKAGSSRFPPYCPRRSGRCLRQAVSSCRLCGSRNGHSQSLKLIPFGSVHCPSMPCGCTGIGRGV
jgi:hypothetical protein